MHRFQRTAVQYNTERHLGSSFDHHQPNEHQPSMSLPHSRSKIGSSSYPSAWIPLLFLLGRIAGLFCKIWRSDLFWKCGTKVMYSHGYVAEGETNIYMERYAVVERPGGPASTPSKTLPRSTPADTQIFTPVTWVAFHAHCATTATMYRRT